MPSVSRRQQRYLYANFGSAWVHAHDFNILDTTKKKVIHQLMRRRKRRKRGKLS